MCLTSSQVCFVTDLQDLFLVCALTTWYLPQTHFFFFLALSKAQSCLGLPSLLYFPSLPSPPSIIGDLATVTTKPAFSWLSHLLWSGRTLVFMGSLLKPFLSSVHPAGWTRLALRCGGSRWSSRLFSLTHHAPQGLWAPHTWAFWRPFSLAA